ncbi:glycosyltransferase family 4 protein [Spirosoma sp. RP8]|uniref:Glycosyltransferase family 4 protein n=1 Tax=Spirosoma liriopis TaxID=2937440 RepID=A0ABT0HFN8_9BACT|nr:glycosyltransferase family 4 protein [Spirosoma liriopis]MCK8490965.1 glycosyltransferase family 4 protein [Spirosoma liriopis]
MYIGVVGPIATKDLLSESELQQHQSCPKGRAGAPLVSSLIKEYINRGHRVLAITIDPAMNDDDAPYIYTKGLLTYVIAPSRKRIFRPNGRRMGRTADFFRFERKHILELLNQFKPEVVHAHWTYEFALAALDYNPNTLITVHDNARTILSYIRTLERVFMFMLARYVFNRGRWFTAVSPYMAESVSEWTSAKVHVVGNPVPIPNVIGRTTIPDKPVISLIVNGWEKRKNCGNALLTFKALQERYPQTVLWGMGDAFEPDGEAVKFCQEHAIDMSNIVLFGSIPYADVLAKIAQSTLVLHASKEESFGMVLAEAMSYGVPVVAGKFSGAVPWVVQDGGLLVDITNVDEMVAAADRLLSDQALYAQLSSNAIEAVKTRFALKTIADQYLDLYQKCSADTIDGSNKLRRTAPAMTQIE